MSERQTDRQTKSSRWQFTAYKDQWGLFEAMAPGIAEWGWQREICPETKREHYQGYLRLTQQQRFAWIAKILPGVHLEIPRNWVALVNYCKKIDTAVPGTQVHQVSTILTHYQYAEEIAKRYYDRYGVSDFDNCVWEIKHTTDRTGLISVALRLDGFIDYDIEHGRRYVAWIVENPSWVAMWRKRYKPFIASYGISNAATSFREGSEGTQDAEEASS
jgi:hypothetical protein